MSEHFEVVDRNPNDDASGGCLCHETKTQDVEGPFAVFYAVAGESAERPHTVLCAPCARAVIREHAYRRGATPDADGSSGSVENRPAEVTTIDLGDEDIIEV